MDILQTGNNACAAKIATAGLAIMTKIPALPVRQAMVLTRIKSALNAQSLAVQYVRWMHIHVVYARMAMGQPGREMPAVDAEIHTADCVMRTRMILFLNVHSAKMGMV